MISLTPPFSRIHRAVLVVGIVCLLTTFASIIFVGAGNDNSQANIAGPTPDPSTRAKIADRFGKLPLSFEVNKGQSDQSVKFLSHGPGYELFLTSTDAVLTLRKPHTSESEKEVREGSVLRLRMIGANSTPRVDGQDELPGKINYFIGNNPDKWRRNIPTYRKVYYTDVYPGIDMVYYGNQRELEYDFVVGPGANPKLIKFKVEGADRIRLDKNGGLLLALQHGEVRLHKPSLYQLTEEGERREVKGEYVINGNEIRFKVQNFDSAKKLVIDPVLSYATFLGGSTGDEAFGVAVDSLGSAYVTGRASLFGFPTTPGAFKTTSNSGGAFVSKLNPTGTDLVYSTLLVGNGNSLATAIAVDSTGNAHITGSTRAEDFPIVNALKTTGNFFKTTDAAANWNNNNTGLVGDVNLIAVAPNAPNTIYAATTSGIHRSTDAGTTWTKPAATGLPVFGFLTAMAVDPTNSLVVYLSTNNGNLHKTTDGGANWNAVTTIPIGSSAAFAIAFDPVTPSTMYVGINNGVFKSVDSGATWFLQTNFGLTSPPNIRSLGIDPTGTNTIYAGTLNNGLFKSINGGGSWTSMNQGMGGDSPNTINVVVIDPSNPSTIYTGHGSQGGINKSTNGATSWAPVNNGVPTGLPINAMVATSSAVYATTSGGGLIKTTNGGTSWTGANAGLGSSQVRALARHPSDPAILYAGTSTSIFGDAFVTKLNASGSGLLFSTLLGGSAEETGNGIALDSNGNIYVVGQTLSSNFPAVNALQPTPSVTNNCGNGFVTKLNPAVPSYVFSTPLGGSNGCDFANAVTTDSAGNVYVTGSTSASDFPIANAFQPVINPGQFNPDAFVTKLSTNGTLSYSTFLGGNGDDTGHAIAVDVSGNAYVTGVTASSNFPTQNPIQTGATADPGGDVFVTKLNAAGSGLLYSTYLRGLNTDIGRGIAIDSTGNAYVTGFTRSGEFPITQGSLRTKSTVYKSVDSGAIWTNDNYGLAGQAITIAVHPTQPSMLYAGTTLGVYRSTNGGRNWSPINNGLGEIFVRDLIVDPVTPTTIYALGNSNTNNHGVWKSTDGGNSWNLRITGMTSTFLTCFAIDPVSPNILYAGFLGGPGSQIYKTTNGADNWAPIGNQSVGTPVAVAVDPNNHTTVYAADSSSAGGVFRSVNSGASWQPVGLNDTGAHADFVSVSPHTAGLLFTMTNLGMLKSVNSGDNWTNVTVPRSGKIVFDPVNPNTIYLISTSDGLFRSTNLGQTWTAINNGLSNPVASAIAIDPLKPTTLYLVSTANGFNEVFLAKLNPAGNALVYSTLIGGTSPPGTTPTNAEAYGIAIDSAGSVYLTGTAAAEMFFTTPNSFQPLNRGASDTFIAKLVNSFIISGHVRDGSSAPISGADVVLSDGSSLTAIVTETDGSYEFSRLRVGGNYTVTATKPHFTMAPASQTFNNLSTDQTLNFTATPTGAAFHTIGGQVTNNGVGIAGVKVTLSGSQPGLRTTDSNGNYSFELVAGGNYTVTPSILGFTFGPPSQTFNNLSAPQTANFAATRQNFVVTTNSNQGTGSLREAIINANATAGLDTITFNIPGPGVKVINLLNALPEIIDPVVIDASTQPGYAGIPLIELDGTNVGSFSGFVIRAGGTTVRGLAIGNFTSGIAAIWIRDCNNNVIQGNYIGVDATGTVQRGNTRGIVLSDSSNNLIGGTTAAARNVISGSSFDGIELGGSNNLVQGNFIGTNAAGTEAIRNGQNGIVISTATFTNNVIGGTSTGAGNLISGNPRGINTNGSGTIIQGNLIGTDVTGTKKVPNGQGVQAGGQDVLIGGLTASARNIISGNDTEGVSFGGEGSKVQGNYIGTDFTGTLPLGNGQSGVGVGIDALVGGTVPEARNVISGNSIGITLRRGSFLQPSTVQGNYIGTDATGARAIGNTQFGISIEGPNHAVGGVTPGAGNVISGNGIGIRVGTLFDDNVRGNTVQGNLIGLNAAGTAPLPNNLRGIEVAGSNDNTIGGTQNGAANKIAFNAGPGVLVFFGTGNSIRGNSIFSNGGLGIDLGAQLGANGVTPNDPNDADVGSNNLQNFPVLTAITSVGNNTTIQGSLNSTPNTTFQIDFYTSAALDPSGNGEGAQFFNTTAVTTNANGNATINASFPVALGTGRVVTATATDPTGNTSEFSAGNATGATGNVQFSVSLMNVIEDIGLMTVTVVRTGGSAGTLTVDYATADGTAIAGQDYTATSGTLTFSGGETTKAFQIPITDDAPTEPNETFTVSLRNTSSLEMLGVPNTLSVTILDRTTVPSLLISNATVIEGGPGTTTQLLVPLNLFAATGRTVSVNFATSNSLAFGGTSCSTRGVDYITTSGTVTFQPGQSSSSIPITICGDSNAEANEAFTVNLSNAVNGQFFTSTGVGSITNDDVLELVLEESGPVANQAAALDALLLVRDPFRIVGIPEWWPTTADRNTRVILFARNLELNPGELPAAVIVRISGDGGPFFDVQAEDVRPIHNFELTEVVFRLPANLPLGTRTVTIGAHTRTSNSGTIRIVQ